MSMYPGLSDEARAWYGLPGRYWESSFFDVAREVYGTGRQSESAEPIEVWEAKEEIRRARIFGDKPRPEAVAIAAAAAGPVDEATLWEAREEIRRARMFGDEPSPEAVAIVAAAEADTPVSEADLWEAREEIRRARIFGGAPSREAVAVVARARAQEQARARAGGSATGGGRSGSTASSLDIARAHAEAALTQVAGLRVDEAIRLVDERVRAGASAADLSQWALSLSRRGVSRPAGSYRGWSR